MPRVWPFRGMGSSSSRGEDTSTTRADPSTPGAGPSTSGARPSTSEAVPSTYVASCSVSAPIDELESRNVRGIANPEQVPRERKRIEIIGNDFSNDHAIRHMSQINRSLVTSAWCTWTHVPRETCGSVFRFGRPNH